MRKVVLVVFVAIMLVVTGCGKKGAPSPRRDIHHPGAPVASASAPAADRANNG